MSDHASDSDAIDLTEFLVDSYRRFPLTNTAGQVFAMRTEVVFVRDDAVTNPELGADNERADDSGDPGKAADAVPG